MKCCINILLTVIGLFINQPQILSQTPDFTGTWNLNLEKSSLEDRPAGLTASVFIIEQKGNKFKLTRYHIYGDKKKKISFKMAADGKTRKVKMLFKCKLEKKENSFLATIWRKNFSNIVDYKFGNNQNELIADEVFISKYSKHHNIWIFDREVQKITGP